MLWNLQILLYFEYTYRSDMLEINIYKHNTVYVCKSICIMCLCRYLYQNKRIIINSFSVFSFMFHSINFIVAVISWTKHSQNTFHWVFHQWKCAHILYRETIFDLFKFSLHLCNALWTLHSQLVSTLYYQMKEILFGICLPCCIYL